MTKFQYMMQAQGSVGEQLNWLAVTIEHQNTEIDKLKIAVASLRALSLIHI